MAIDADALRNDAMRDRIDRQGGNENNCCQLCGKPMRVEKNAVQMNHETGEFVTESEAANLADKVSLYYVGSDCARKIQRALTCA